MIWEGLLLWIREWGVPDESQSGQLFFLKLDYEEEEEDIDWREGHLVWSDFIFKAMTFIIFCCFLVFKDRFLLCSTVCP